MSAHTLKSYLSAELRAREKEEIPLFVNIDGWDIKVEEIGHDYVRGIFAMKHATTKRWTATDSTYQRLFSLNHITSVQVWPANS